MKQIQKQESMPLIGLEIHAYLVTKEKLFCKCTASREKGLKPNTNICPICTGQPGAKPMLANKEAVKKAVQLGLMLNCKINPSLIWQRKHYDWPDMPKGYQNTISGTYAVPLGTNGEFGGIGLWSMHLEEDPASWEPETGQIDYNRSGLPLVEIITAPDFTSSNQVMSWLKKLIHNLAYLKAVDSNAGIKVDVNVNIHKKTERVEIKNISSIENIGKAIEYELKRQEELIKENKKGEKETRRFDPQKEITVRMRGKEEAEDYRFISDPDLSNINLKKEFIKEIKDSIPQSPEEKLKNFINNHKIDKKNAETLSKNIDVAEFFEEISKNVDSKFALPWVTVELLRFLNYNKTTLDKVKINPNHFVSLLNLVKQNKITELQGKQLLNKFYPESFDPSSNIEQKITSEKELEVIIKVVIKENPKPANDYKSGEKQAFNYLMGEIMKKTERRADFAIARKVLERLLK